jgi:hypothetical protein
VVLTFVDRRKNCVLSPWGAKGGDTAQGNALGTPASCARHIAVLTGTLLGGYALDLFNILFRLEPSRMLEEGFEHGEAGVRAFTEAYGLPQKIAYRYDVAFNCLLPLIGRPPFAMIDFGLRTSGGGQQLSAPPCEELWEGLGT